MLNQLNQVIVKDDAPKCQDPSHDDLWSAQAKRYHRLGSEQESAITAKSAAKIHGRIKAVK